MTKLLSEIQDNDNDQNIKSKAIKGGTYSFISQLIVVGSRIITSIVLARLLLPTDFGLVGMVNAIFQFSVIFKGLGFSTAIIQKKIISEKEISKMFYTNLYISLIITFLLILASPLISKFYNEDRLLKISLSLSFTYLFSGLAIIHQAVMRRKLQFKKIAYIDILSSTLTMILAIILGFVYKNYWALTINILAFPILNMIFTYIFFPWRPKFPARKTKIQSLIKFGVDVTAFNVLNYFSRNFDKIIIGKKFGEAQLGFYQNAYNLLLFPITQLRAPIASVAIPILSRFQSNINAYREYYFKIQFILAFVTMPVIAYLFIEAKDIIIILLGDKWIFSADIFQALSISAFLQPVASLRGTIMLTAGYSRRYLYWGLINSSIIVLGFIIGSYWGVLGIAYSNSFVVLLIFFPSLFYCLRNTNITVSLFLKPLLFPLVFSITATIFTYFFKLHFINEVSNIYVRGISLGLIFFILYITLFFVFRSSRKIIITLKSIVNEFVKIKSNENSN